MRRTTTSGTSVELAQRMGWQANNSAFLVPNPQSTSRLELAVTQPLMAGRGESYQLRRVVEARLIAEGTQAESLAKIQNTLLQVHQRYWDLYRTRAIFLQRRQAVERAEQLSQSLQARTALIRPVASWLGRKLRWPASSSIDDRSCQRGPCGNRVASADRHGRLRIGVGACPRSSTQSIDHRHWSSHSDRDLTSPEIESAVREIKIAGVRVGASRNELMPKLDFIAGPMLLV